MKVVNNKDEVIEVTEKAYDVIYKHRGFTPYTEKKKTAQTSSAKKKVKSDGNSGTSK